MFFVINMLTKADKVKGQGVGSASEEAIALVKNGIGDAFKVVVNENIFADITHIHSINPTFFLKVRKLKRHGKVVGSVHFLPETVEKSLNMPKFAKKAFYWYMLKMYDKMDYLVTVNPYFIERLSHYGIDKEKISYIPNFVDDKKFYALSQTKKNDLKESYGLEKDVFTVVCAGQLQTRKGIFDFIECAKKLPSFQFVWAGGFSFGVISDGHSQIKKILGNPPKNVHFLGIIDRDKMNDVYNLGDVMFLPSYEELFPMTILEAMNCKIPILVRDLEIYRNILFDFYLKANDVDGFVEILKRLSKDNNFYENASKMSFNGHLFYNDKHVLTMWKEFYGKIVDDLKNDRKLGKCLHKK